MGFLLLTELTVASKRSICVRLVGTTLGMIFVWSLCEIVMPEPCVRQRLEDAQYLLFLLV